MKITVLSGFLGAGKTTLLNKLLPALEEDLVVVENEFGEISVDRARIGSQLPVHEINAGCICCSLADDFQRVIGQIGTEKQHAHILIEPSGVGKLSDVVKACSAAAEKKMLPLEGLLLITVVDIAAFESDLQDFGDFYLDQIANADLILCSYVTDTSEERKNAALKKIRAINSRALIYEEDWYEKDGQELVTVLEAVTWKKGQPISSQGAFPDEHHLNSAVIEGLCAKDEAQISGWIKKWTIAGKILRIKGCVGIGAKGEGTLQVDYTAHHCCLQNIKKQPRETLIFIGYDLDINALRNCIKEGDQIEKDS